MEKAIWIWNDLRFLVFCVAVLFVPLCNPAELVIEIPGNAVQEGSEYRLDYYPPYGIPQPNTTFQAKDVLDNNIKFQGRPGTKYNFRLYFSNATFHDLLTWNETIVTAPQPLTNLSVQVKSGKAVNITWNPPTEGHYSGFRFKVLPLNELSHGGGLPRNFTVDGDQLSYELKDLYPGASYQIQAFTVLEDKESAAYTSRNFTTKPNTPGKFIVWFRNETTLLVLWQPPYPAGAYSHYKVSIQPPDPRDSELFVEKEGEPPGPAQAAFKGLVPGRAYNISVQTISENEISTPTTAQYRTVPLRPLNVTIDKDSITSNSFKVSWEPPKEKSEFDKYQISLSVGRRVTVRSRSEPTSLALYDLEPGRTYTVTVKTTSGKVTSWPSTADVTLRPLPVENLNFTLNQTTGVIVVSWTASNESTQDSFKVSYHEVGPSRDDSSTLIVDNSPISLDGLLPGRNYSISVQALSNKVESNESIRYVATRPLEPIISELKPLFDGFNISWSSDVNSKQDKYRLIYRPQSEEDGYETIKKETHDTWYAVHGLFPGAIYQVQISALSHGLESETHPRTAAVLPLPPRSISIKSASSNSVTVHWTGPDPTQTRWTHYVLRYKTGSDTKWQKLPTVLKDQTAADITDMTHGEMYTIQLDTASDSVESGKPKEATHKVKPNPVSNVAILVDSRNITLEWPRPEGRVERYVVSWYISEKDIPQETHNSRNVSGEMLEPRVSIDQLQPGTNYHFQIDTLSYGLYGDSFHNESTTRPLSESEITTVIEKSHPEGDRVVVLYTLTPPSASRLDLYRFALTSPDHPKPIKVEKKANDESRRVVFDNLIPGQIYNVTMWTVSHNVTSQPLQKHFRLYPKPITQLNATDITDTNITLVWDEPQGVWTDFEISYYLSEENVVKTLTTKEKSITVVDLKPFRNYTFTAHVLAGNATTILMKSNELSASFKTKEGKPGPVQDFHPIDSKPSEITFTWNMPESEHNGNLTRFVLTYRPKSLSSEERDKPFVLELAAHIRTATIVDLIPGTSYEFSIRAETSAGAGPEVISIQNMTIAAPPKPALTPSEVGKTSSSLQVQFGKDYFSSQNGNITLFTLIVGEDISRNTSDIRLPSWRDVQEYSLWPPYQVMEPYYPFLTNSLVEYTIGSQQCTNTRSTYCNGPLKSGTKYYVKLRAFTAPDKFTDTEYTEMTTDPDNTAWIATGGALACVIVIGLAVWGIRRVRKLPRPAPSAPPPARPVRLPAFPEHYRSMAADSDFRFSEEFEELKHVGRDQPCTAADLPCNRPKNRFTNILPYDHSRFKLQPVDDEEGSDYINANYVPGYNSPREFIVTQGPLHSTRDDFWRMVWESNSRAIVMLTRCFEKGREKCDHYWPYDTRPVYYGDICVTVLNEQHYPDWAVTEFMLCRGDQQRVVKHFHFTTWPDFGVPSPPTTLARFVRAFRDRCPPDQRPVVVHCSAGVGRSGTFITLDRLLQQIAAGADSVDIFGMVRAMRRERVWMVQTEQQYICIHQCLLAVLEGHDNQPQHQIHHNQAFEDDEGIAESGM